MTKKTVITMLLDESGSMGHLQGSTIAGFNEFVNAQKETLADEQVFFSAIKFDTRGVRKLQTGAAIKDAIKLDHNNYQPNGGTPLLDAVARTIEATDEVAGKHLADAVIVVIQTDGEENASRDFNLEQVKTMVEERQGKGWQFVFMGAGINAFASGVQMGFQAANTMSYGANAAATMDTFSATATNSRMFRSGAKADMGYTESQSLASGESASITRAKMAKTVTPPMPLKDDSAPLGKGLSLEK